MYAKACAEMCICVGGPMMMQPVMRTRKIVIEKKVTRKKEGKDTSPVKASPALQATAERKPKDKKEKKVKAQPTVEEVDTATAKEKKPKKKRSWWQQFELS